MRRAFAPLAVILLALAGTAAAQGGSDPYQGDRKFRDRASIDLGWVLATFDSKASLDSATGPGTDIDLESGLGLEKDTNDFFLNGYYRFKPKHRLEASYYSLRREGTRVLDQTINWGDYTWDVNATVKSDTKATFGRIGYAWSFVKKDRGEVSLHGDIAYFETGLTIEGITSSGTARKEDGSAGFPYPTIGLSSNVYLGKRTVMDLRLDWIGGVEVSGVSGSILAGEIGFRCYFTQHFGLGAHWLLSEMDATTTDSSRELEVDWGWDGLTGTLAFVW